MSTQNSANNVGSPYFDEDGLPCLCDAVVVFFDLLGTRGLREGPEATAYLRTVYQAVGRAREASVAIGGPEATGRASRWFSDNLGLGYPMPKADDQTWWLAFTIMEVAYLHAAFIEHGLFARGALAVGPFFADGEFIHGPVLERAVALEKARAKYARTVLDEASIAIAATASSRDGQHVTSPWQRHLFVDADGVVGVDYFGVLKDDPAGATDVAAFVRSHGKLVTQCLRRYDGVPGIEEKYRWLSGYHNWCIERHELEATPVACSRPLGRFAPFGGNEVLVAA